MTNDGSTIKTLVLLKHKPRSWGNSWCERILWKNSKIWCHYLEENSRLSTELVSPMLSSIAPAGNVATTYVKKIEWWRYWSNIKQFYMLFVHLFSWTTLSQNRSYKQNHKIYAYISYHFSLILCFRVIANQGFDNFLKRRRKFDWGQHFVFLCLRTFMKGRNLTQVIVAFHFLQYLLEFDFVESNAQMI